MLPPLAAGFTRLTVAAVGGYVATRVFGRGLPALDTVMAAGLVAYALVMVVVARRELGLVLFSRTSLGRVSTDPHDLLLDELDDRIE